MYQPIQYKQNNKFVSQMVEQFSPQSEFLPQHHLQINKNFTTVTDVNFVKSIKHGFSSNIICLYEEKPFTIQFRNIQKFWSTKQETLLNVSSQNNEQSQTYRIYDIGNNIANVQGEITLENIPYDGIQFQYGLWLLSTKSMPPRMYKKPHDDRYPNTIMHIGSIYNRKKNSQIYLSPIQISYNKNNPGYAVGGGKKFMSKYNLEKMGVEEMYGKFDKCNISAVGMINSETVVVGTFQGALCVLDLRESQNVGEQQKDKIMLMRPHVDAIMSIAVNPVNQFIFATNARKDNYTYIWDCRKYNNQSSAMYLSEFIIPKNNNQRISMSWNHDGKILYSGSESSQIIGCNCQMQTSLQLSEKIGMRKWKVGDNGPVNSVLSHSMSKAIVFSTGSRTFQQIIDPQETQQIPIIKSRKNILGCISPKTQ